MPKGGYELIKTLKSKLVCTEVVKQNDALDECIIEMFGEGEELEKTDISIHNNYTNIPDQEEQNEDNGIATEVRSTSSSVPKVSLGSAFLLGRKK